MTAEQPLFAAAVELHMTSPVTAIGPSDRVRVAEQALQAADATGLPVVDSLGKPIGMLSTTDLLALSAVPAVTGTRDQKLILPDKTVAEIMQRDPLCVEGAQSVAKTAALMHEHGVHRVCVVNGPRLVGILTTWDVARLVAQSKLQVPLEAMMSPSVVTVTPDEPATQAAERLRAAATRSLLVLDGGFPVGVFGQEQALAVERSTNPGTVEDWLDPAVLAMPPTVRACRAAAQLVATRTRRIAVLDGRSLGGIVSDFDFLPLAAG